MANTKQKIISHQKHEGKFLKSSNMQTSFVVTKRIKETSVNIHLRWYPKYIDPNQLLKQKLNSSSSLITF